MAVDFKEYGRRMDKALEHLDEEFGAVHSSSIFLKIYSHRLCPPQN